MAQRSTIAINMMALFALLLSFTFHFQGQGAWGPAGVGGEADKAEFVLLEPIPERILAVAVNATDPDTQQTSTEPAVCLQCHCCLNNTNPQVCLTTCCYQRISGNPQVVSCGCNHCVPPPAQQSHRPPPRTN